MPHGERASALQHERIPRFEKLRSRKTERLQGRHLVQHVDEVLAEVDGLVCVTCTAPADDEADGYCMACRSYWDECSRGLWNDDYNIDMFIR